MRRRRLLAAVGTAALGALAGCGYAPAGGEVRRTGGLDPGGIGPQVSGALFAVDDDRVVGVANGRHYVFGADGTEFVDGADLTVVGRDGSSEWGYVHRSDARALALGDGVYLLDEASRVVAVGPTEVDGGDDDGSTETEITERWRVPVVDPTPPLVAAGATAYVAAADGVAAVRDGGVAWRRSFEAVDALRALDGGLLVRTGETLVALDGAGGRRWRRSVAPGATVAVEAGRAVVAGESVVGIGLGGTAEWDLESSGAVRGLVGTDGRVAVLGSDGTRVVAADDGTELWAGGATVRPDAIVVGPEALYYVLGRAVGAVDGDGRRWRRGLSDDRAGCCPAVGWLDGETVAFLLKSGEIVWLQRATQNRGLL
ncbi:hypothetical protein BRD02_01980 [Halobacteriales archaeon QS_8_69_73]|nr:MAG: hypothetical protein BRD02_01980 [Halobacteriales archaeon QS_8_69_73]